MRPNKFRSQVNKAIMHRITTGSVEKFTPYLTKSMTKVWYKWAVAEQDFRNGTESYGYNDEDDYIKYTLIYISDRWRCAFRLKWLIDLVEMEKV